MKTAFYKTSLGIIKISYKEKILKIELVAEISGKNEKTLASDRIIRQIDQYLKGERKEFTIYDLISLEASDFQKAVYQALLNIPYGQTKSYKDIARAIGREKAVRAVSTAIGKNPFMIIIPCHRVIGSDGKLRGYAYGLDIKKKLLEIEGINI